MILPGSSGGDYYRQLADWLTAQIARGEMEAGDAMIAAQIHCAYQSLVAPLYGGLGDVSYEGFVAWLKEQRRTLEGELTATGGDDAIRSPREHEGG